TAKEKSRRNADIISCAQEAAARFSEPPLLFVTYKNKAMSTAAHRRMPPCSSLAFYTVPMICTS
ncbi:MAG: hypothetical protein ACLRSD_02900, partial [Oscillibacter sp.]